MTAFFMAMLSGIGFLALVAGLALAAIGIFTNPPAPVPVEDYPRLRFLMLTLAAVVGGIGWGIIYATAM